MRKRGLALAAALVLTVGMGVTTAFQRHRPEMLWMRTEMEFATMPVKGSVCANGRMRTMPAVRCRTDLAGEAAGAGYAEHEEESVCGTRKR